MVIKVEDIQVIELLMAAEYVEFVNFVLNDEILNRNIDCVCNILW